MLFENDLEMFPASYKEILQRIDRIDPVKYSSTRNYMNGAVSYLSPYISRGVISYKICFQSIDRKRISCGAYGKIHPGIGLARLLATSLDPQRRRH